MKKTLYTGLVVAVLATTTTAATAQTGEVFIPGSSPTFLPTQPEVAQNPLAACLANANAQNCANIDIDPNKVEFESFSAGPAIAYETLVFDLNGGGVATTDKPSDYTSTPATAPVDPYAQPANPGYTQPPVDPYAQPANPGYTQPPVDPYAQPSNPGYAQAVVDPYQKPVDPYATISLPAVAITIEFDFNSAGIRADQYGKLNSLSEAFRDPALVNAQFAVIGHTDASGSDYYNCDLSLRRASEVARALRANYVNLPLYQVGFGEHVLKNVYDPRAPENRRVTFLRLPADYTRVLQTSKSICGL